MFKHRYRIMASAGFAISLVHSGAVLAQTTVPADETIDGQEIIVTATRSSEAASRVPVSIAVFSQEKMDQQGIKQFADLVRFTPGLALNASPTGSNNVSIRGISSGAGAATTGIYIDDVPIQVRQIGFAAGSSFPIVFDLERIEVLRGPQGTLFGSGSEGGTVRFIQPDPSTTDWSLYGRIEGSITPKADGSYEAGIAVGGPIVQDKVGFRASAFYRRDGGWIDKVPGTLALIDPSLDTTLLLPGTATSQQIIDNVRFTPTGEGEKNYNSVETMAFRGALKFTPTETLSITPSIFYQERSPNSNGNGIWPSASDLDSGRFVTVDFSPGAPAPGNGLTAMSLPDTESGKATMLVAAIELEWNVGDDVTIYSTSSYLKQKKHQYLDFTTGYELPPYQFSTFPQAGTKGMSLYQDSQRSYTQELRIQSADPDARLRWVAGAFFTQSRQVSDQLIESNTFFHSDSYFGIPNMDDGTPFGPGFNNFQNIWGAPMIGESGVYSAHAVSREKQLAGFGQLDFKIVDKLTLTVGARVSKNWLNYSLDGSGPENNLNAPFGAPCPTGPTCPYGSGVFAPIYPVGAVKNVEKAFTPKVGLSYQADDRNLFYATVAKGYRPGGGQIPLPSACSQDLINFGYVDANGVPSTPATYGSDSVWSYEVGSKNRIGNAASISASAYMIKWKNIQTNLLLPTCFYNLVDNLTAATVKGFDLSLDLRPARGLTLNATVGYTHSSLDEALVSPGGGAILSKGSAIGASGSPWTIVLSGQYEADLSAETRGYIRGDMSYNSKHRVSGTTDPATIGYNAYRRPDPEVTLVNARLGVAREGYDLSLFVDNLFDVSPTSQLLNVENVFTAQTIRPRTMGLTLTVRR